jgi:hypothetical protein
METVKKKTLRAVVNRAERLGCLGRNLCLGEGGKIKERRRIRRCTEQLNAF